MDVPTSSLSDNVNFNSLIYAATSVPAKAATQVFILIGSFPQASIVILTPKIAYIVCWTDTGDMHREQRPSSHANSPL